MRSAARVLVAGGWMLAVLLVPATASWAAPDGPDQSETLAPSEPQASDLPGDEVLPDPVVVTVTPEPAPTVTETVIVPAAPETPKDAPGVNSGVYVDPASGAVRMGEKSTVALGVGVWLASLLAGLATAYLVMP